MIVNNNFLYFSHFSIFFLSLQRYGFGTEFVKWQECTECIIGKFLDIEGKTMETDCKICFKGRSAAPKGSPSQSNCPLCTPGRYQDQPELLQIECKPCKSGSFGNETGRKSADECGSCTRGFYVDNTILALTVEDCKECAPGYYTDQMRQPECKACEFGRYHDGLTEIDPSTGMVSRMLKSFCKNCPAGYYQDEDARIHCEKKCPAGRYGETVLQQDLDKNGLRIVTTVVEAEANTEPSNNYVTVRVKLDDPNAFDYGRLRIVAGMLVQNLPLISNPTTATPLGTCAGGTGLECTEIVLGPKSICIETKNNQGEVCSWNPIIQSDEQTDDHSTMLVRLTSDWKTDDVVQGPLKMVDDDILTFLDLIGQELTFIVRSGFTSYKDCKLCPAGRWSDDVSGLTHTALDCTPCAGGQYSQEEGCSNYITGKVDERFLVGGGEFRECKWSCALCPKGRWSESIAADNITYCQDCVEGKFLDREGKTSPDACINCPKGRYGTREGLVSGIYRTDLTFSEMCTGCTPGKYNDKEGEPNSTACIDCPLGYWLETSNDQQPRSNVKVSNCKACIPGRYADGTGFTYRTQQKDTNGIDIHINYCKACRAGYYLPEQKDENGIVQGSTTIEDCIPCLEGTFSVKTGLDDALFCSECPTGFYGPIKGLQQGRPNTGACSLREGAGEVSSRSCNSDLDCPVWSVCAYNTTLTNGTSCTACEVGKYNENTGKANVDDCKNCPVGKYNAETGATSAMFSNNFAFCHACPVGFYLEVEASIAVSNCKSCIKGRYGKDKGTKASDGCQECGKGLYSDVLSTLEFPIIQTSCKECPQGKFGPDKGFDELSDCIDCPKGKYSSENAMTKSIRCKSCRRGFYTDDIAATSPENCVGCLSGRYGLEIDDNMLCGTGESCQDTYCADCPKGFFQTYSATSTCELCGDGHFSAAASSEQTICPEGYFGRASQNGERYKCDKCIVGKYGNELGLPNVGRCKSCLPGRYNDETAIVNEDECKLCGVGRYNDKEGLAIPDGRDGIYCTACNAGSIQPDLGSKECLECSPGQSQEKAGDVQCLSCLAGKYQHLFGKAECNDCMTGFYGTEIGREDCDMCPKGWYQDELGLEICEGCPLGCRLNLFF